MTYWFDSGFVAVPQFCCCCWKLTWEWDCWCWCCKWWMLSWEGCCWCTWNIWEFMGSCWLAMPLEGSDSLAISWVATFSRRTSAVNASFRAVIIEQLATCILKIFLKAVRNVTCVADKCSNRNKKISRLNAHIQNYWDQVQIPTASLELLSRGYMKRLKNEGVYEKVNNLWKNFILYLPSPANQPQNQQNPEKNTLYYIREQLRWNAHTGCMINNNLIGAKWTTNEAYALFLKQVKQAQSFTMYETPNTWWENLARKSI